MANYESEHTKFMREWMKNHPEQLVEQESGRALWWEKKQDADTTKRYAEARVPAHSYYYDYDS